MREYSADKLRLLSNTFEPIFAWGRYPNFIFAGKLWLERITFFLRALLAVPGSIWIVFLGLCRMDQITKSLDVN